MNSQTTTNKISKKILVITTNRVSYPGADTAGQEHLKYTENALIIRVPDPVIFSPEFYVRTLEKGYGGIIVASAGDESPYKGSHERLTKNIDAAYKLMKEKGIDDKRLKLTAICSVCAARFVEEIKYMQEYLEKIAN